MLESDGKPTQKYAPFLQRVLILDQRAPARVLTELLKDLGGGEIRTTITAKDAAETARDLNPQLIFTELGGLNWDGLQFVRSIRRSELPCRKAPIIMVTAEAFAHAILGARDAGVHEFMRKPYALKDLLRRIDAVTMRERDWTEAVAYVGPDRRRFNSGEYAGQPKRRSDAPPTTDAVHLDQALRIVRSAIAAMDEDPRQAVRALQAQANLLARLAVVLKDSKLASGTARLQRQLDDVNQPTKQQLEDAAGPLLAYLPPTMAA